MNIGIVGQGYVGTAVQVVFSKHYNVNTYDINHELRTCSSLENLVACSDVIFICLPTPMNNNGSCNIKIVEDVVSDINKFSSDIRNKKIIAIKSTIPPGTTDSLNNKYENISVIFNPEFLTEANFIEDFKNQERIIIGGENTSVQVLVDIYSSIFTKSLVLKTESKIAEMVKYFTNTFLATKVSFANEMKNICDTINVDYNKVLEISRLDHRLGQSHWEVPGPDGSLGFGGSCLPKDLNALLYFCKKNNIELNTLEGVWNTNLKMRPLKDWENLKGRAVVDDEK